MTLSQHPRRATLMAAPLVWRLFASLLAVTIAAGPLPAVAAPARKPKVLKAPVKPPPVKAEPKQQAPATELTGDETGVLPFNTCKRQSRTAKFTITLPKEAQLQDLVNWMMTISCQKFIWDPGVRGGKVTILSPEPVTVSEAYAAFYAALQTMGLTVEPSGEYFKIVETAAPEGKSLPVYGPDARAPGNDRFVTQLIRSASGNTKDIVDLLNKMKSKAGNVQTVGDLIILTDSGSNVRRLMRIVEQIDDPEVAGERIFFYQLKYASAEDVANIVREIFGEATKGQPKQAPRPGEHDPTFSRVIVDERSGTLVIVAQDNDYKVIRRLVEHLDVPLSAAGAGRVHVVRLQNADPEEVANVLSQLASGARPNTRRPPNQPPQPDAAAELFSGEIKVTADKATRSLVITASATDFESLRDVIDALDQERKQVYIEVYLLELSINKRLEAGASGHFGAPFTTSAGEGLGFVATAPGAGSNSLVLGPDMLSGIVGGVLGAPIPGSQQFFGALGRDIPAFGVLIQALQQSSDVNVVSQPHVYTADNQEATIEVGRNVPTPGALTFPGGAGNTGGIVPVQSIQREDVTLKVKLTPHINDERTVTLDVEMDNRDIESIDQRLGVTTTKRRLKLDKVVARDDQPVVLGGLVQEIERETVRQVPGLGSVPLLGWLFKRKVKERQKVNLMMILVPHIVTTADDVRRIHERRVAERLEFLERQTAFKKRELETNVNYRSKSGLLASIDREAKRMEDEFTRLKVVQEELKQDSISGEIGLSPRAGEDDATTPKPSGTVVTPSPAPPPQQQPPPPPPPPPPNQ